MTHILDRHCTADAFKLAAQKRVSVDSTHDLFDQFPIKFCSFQIANLESGQPSTTPKQPYPVTLYRQPNAQSQQDSQSNLANGPTNIQNAGLAAMQAIKRHSIDFIHLKDVSVSLNIFHVLPMNFFIIYFCAIYSSKMKQKEQSQKVFV